MNDLGRSEMKQGVPLPCIPEVGKLLGTWMEKRSYQCVAEMVAVMHWDPSAKQWYLFDGAAGSARTV